MFPWSFLESLPGLRAVWPIWRDNLYRHYEPFKTAFLKPVPEDPVKFVPSIARCGVLHEVVTQPDGSMLAVCTRGRCDAYTVLPDDIIPLELDWPKFSRALAATLRLEPKFARAAPYHTFQIGIFNHLPVLLTVQSCTGHLLHALTALIGQLNQPFIVLSPTTAFLTAPARTLLQSVGAACFGLDSLVDFREDGSLVTLTDPAALFRQLPPPLDQSPDFLPGHKAFALIQKLSAGPRAKAPTVLAVFRLYCIEERSIPEIARKCRCSVATVANRLRIIRSKTGKDPLDLRTFAKEFVSYERHTAEAKRNFSRRRYVMVPAYQSDEPEPRDD